MIRGIGELFGGKKGKYFLVGDAWQRVGVFVFFNRTNIEKPLSNQSQDGFVRGEGVPRPKLIL